MKKRNFAIVSTEDEQMFLSEKNNHSNKCSACGRIYNIGGTIICSTNNWRVRYCQNCLMKMQAVLSDGRKKNCSRWNFSVKKYNGNKVSSFSKDKKAEFVFYYPKFRLYLTSDELDMIYHQTDYFNSKHNDSFIYYKEKINNRKNEMLFKNLKWKYYNDAIKAIKYISDPVLAERYFRLCDSDKENYLKKIIAKNSISENSSVKIDKRMFEEESDSSTHNIGSKVRHLTKSTKFKIQEKISPCDCDSINHIKANTAKYHISTNNKNIPFAITGCNSCLLSLKNAIEGSLINTYYENNEIHITKTIFQDDNHCLFCKENSGINNRIHIKNVEFNCCDQHKTELLNTINSVLG